MSRITAVLPSQRKVRMLAEMFEREGISQQVIRMEGAVHSAQTMKTDAQGLAWMESSAEGMEDFQPYAEVSDAAQRQGGIIITADVPGEQEAKAKQLLEQAGATDIKD